VGKGRIIERGFVLIGGKRRINNKLRLALNVVQYYNVRLKSVGNVAAATGIVALEKREKC
jgi:hypothetical protein